MTTGRLEQTQAFWDSLTGEEGASARQREYVGAQWAHRWPSECVWVARRARADRPSLDTTE